MRQSHGLLRPSGAFFRLQFSAGYTINMFGLDFRHGHMGVAGKNSSNARAMRAGVLDQAFPFWIIAGPSNNGSKRSFDISSIGPVDLGPQGFDSFQRMHIELH